ncbi:hypothetical protein AVDCRST_MAG84-3212, partial [uncultured Microcoleus sp.]
ADSEPFLMKAIAMTRKQAVHHVILCPLKGLL